MIFQKNGNAMAAHRFFGKRAGTFRDEVAVFQSDGLLIQTRITDDSGRDLRIIGLDDAELERLASSSIIDLGSAPRSMAGSTLVLE